MLQALKKVNWLRLATWIFVALIGIFAVLFTLSALGVEFTTSSSVNQTLSGMFKTYAVLDDIAGVVANWITEVLEWVVASFEGVIPIFYDATATPPALTFYGVLALLGLAIGFTGLAIGFIRGMITK